MGSDIRIENILCLLTYVFETEEANTKKKKTTTTLSSHLQSGTLGYQQFQTEQRAQEKGTKAKLVWLSQDLEQVKKQGHE